MCSHVVPRSDSTYPTRVKLRLKEIVRLKDNYWRDAKSPTLIEKAKKVKEQIQRVKNTSKNAGSTAEQSGKTEQSSGKVVQGGDVVAGRQSQSAQNTAVINTQKKSSQTSSCEYFMFSLYLLRLQKGRERRRFDEGLKIEI